jgi:hypothetical protein
MAPVSAASTEAAHEDKSPTAKLAEHFQEWADLLQAPQGLDPKSAPPVQVAKLEPGAKSQELVAKPEAAAHQGIEIEPQEQVAQPEPEAQSEARVAKPELAPNKEPETDPEAELAIKWPPAFIPAISPAASEASASAIQVVPAARSEAEATEPEAVPETPVASVNPVSASPNPEAVEAAIQRVMERMQPQIAALVTRDILRPLVEALVQQELKK